MMIKRHFLKPVAAMAFLCAIAQFFCVSRASASVFHPEAAWAVGPIAAESLGGVTYCSMKNTYTAGRTIVFARDNQGNNSVAVNLNRNLFRGNRRYSVLVRAGHATRRLVALAASSQILVMETGVDTALYNAISASHEISFSVSHRRYAFDLNASVADGLTALGHCADALQNGAAFSAMTIPLARREKLTRATPKMPAPQEQAAAKGVNAPSPENEAKAQIAKQVLQLTNPTPAPSAPVAPVEAVAAPVVTAPPVALKAPVAKASVAPSVASKPAPAVSAPESAPAPAVVAKAAPATVPPLSSAIAPPPPMPAPVLLTSAAALPQAQKPVSTPVVPQSVASQAVPAPVQPKQEPVATPAAPQVVSGNAYLKELLETAHVASGAEIKASSDRDALHWSSGSLFGSAQQLTMSSGASLKMMAGKYLKKTAALCAGEYAKKVYGAENAGAFKVLKADVTCIDGKNNAAAAILFVAGQGKFNVITQEGTVDQLTAAMSSRDSIVAVVSKAAKN